MRLIDADALLDAISVHLERIEQEVDDAPTIDPIRHGWWSHSEYAGTDYYQCNLCGKSVRHTAEKYCPNCGARMDGSLAGGDADAID